MKEGGRVLRVLCDIDGNQRLTKEGRRWRGREGGRGEGMKGNNLVVSVI